MDTYRSLNTASSVQHHPRTSCYSSNRADDLKARVDLRDIVNQFIGPPKRKTDRYSMYFSPFRDDGHNPDFAVYADGYHDYGSGEHGDPLDFIQRITKCSFPEAIQFFEQYLGSAVKPVPHATHVTTKQRTSNTNEPPSIEWQKAARTMLEEAQDYLWSGKPDALKALEYLHQQTMTDETIKKHGLGFNPHQRTFNNVTLPAGIVFPIETTENNTKTLWRLSVRTNIPNKKYMNATGSKLGGLFNADAIVPDKPTIIVEGEKDAIVLQQAVGDLAAVVTFGGVSSKGYLHWRNHLKQGSRVYVSLDNDEPGQKASKDMVFFV